MESIEECNRCLSKCEEVIEKVKDKLYTLKVVGLLEFLPLDLKEKNVERIKNYENLLQITKTEKLLFTLLINPQAEKTMFPLILKKYDELVEISIDLSKNRVISGLEIEGDHLEFCKLSLNERQKVKQLCVYGENR